MVPRCPWLVPISKSGLLNSAEYSSFHPIQLHVIRAGFFFKVRRAGRAFFGDRQERPYYFHAYIFDVRNPLKIVGFRFSSYDILAPEAVSEQFAPARMSRDLPVPRHDFEELVWENGTLLLMRGGRSSNINYKAKLDNTDGFSSAFNNLSKYDPVRCKEAKRDREGKAERSTREHNRVFLFAANRPSDQVPQSIRSRSSGGKMNKVNFSLFLGHQSATSTGQDQGSGSASSRINGLGPVKVEVDELRENPSPEESVRVEAETDSNSIKAVPLRLGAGNDGDFLVPDEYSQAAISSNFIKDHEEDTSLNDDDDGLQVPSQDWSMEASSSPHRKQQASLDVSESTYFEEDEYEEMEDDKRRRRRPQTDYGQSKKKRGDRINKRIRALHELLPNSDKVEVDKASVLDKAIEYMKTLQLQLQMMSTRNRLFASPMAMLPAVIHQMPMPCLNQFSPIGFGMGIRMGSPCFPQGLAQQFPVPGISPGALAGGLQIIGCTPYTPVLGGHPAALRPFVNVNQVDFSRTASMVMEQLASAPISNTNDSNQSNALS
ncbi:hypothetical protein SAY86_029215 [Trapa natans]|uniref:BHLH domain-containing protein n=1 Tax=Trapa natans TaxID=22666 RepID=A0AAN7M3C6_TRANT|nr:hypothetical protein SAY86_029215 [Trapa natans]